MYGHTFSKSMDQPGKVAKYITLYSIINTTCTEYQVYNHNDPVKKVPVHNTTQQ